MPQFSKRNAFLGKVTRLFWKNLADFCFWWKIIKSFISVRNPVEIFWSGGLELVGQVLRLIDPFHLFSQPISCPHERLFVFILSNPPIKIPMHMCTFLSFALSNFSEQSRISHQLQLKVKIHQVSTAGICVPLKTAKHSSMSVPYPHCPSSINSRVLLNKYLKPLLWQSFVLKY